MTPFAGTERRPVDTLRDLVSLAKPRVTMMVLLTTAGGMALAARVGDGVALSAGAYLVTILATGLVVGSANALNCWLERDFDRLMPRTRDRALPSGRLDPNLALWFGLLLAVVSVPMLTLGVNSLAGLLSAIALASYTLVYTPMKRTRPAALLVGSVPGALPPLIGWTAATGRLDWAGVVLFGILFFWQLPHFIAISIFREKEYARAGFKVLPSVRGLGVAKVHAVLHTVGLLAVTLLLVPLQVAGWFYLVVATGAGCWMLVVAVQGLHPEANAAWARRLFKVTLVYLPLLFAALAIDRLI